MALLKSRYTISTNRVILLTAEGNTVSQVWCALTESMLAFHNNLVLCVVKNGLEKDLFRGLPRN